MYAHAFDKLVCASPTDTTTTPAGFRPLTTKPETEVVDAHDDRMHAVILRKPPATEGDDEYIPKLAPITRKNDVPVAGAIPLGELEELDEIVGLEYVHAFVKILVTSDSPETTTLIDVGIFPGAILQASEV